MSTISPRVGTLLKTGMYLLSLWLLFILVIVNKINVPICLDCRLATSDEAIKIAMDNYLAIICVVFLVISGGFYYYFVGLIQESKDGPYAISEVENKNADNLVFLATYVIPLIGFGLDSVRQLLDLTITLVVLAVIFVKTNLFYANPTLSILGFKVFSAKMNERHVILITRESIDVNDSVNTLLLDRNVYFAKKATAVKA